MLDGLGEGRHGEVTLSEDRQKKDAKIIAEEVVSQSTDN